MPTRYEASKELLYKLVTVDAETGCHIWQGAPNHNGYGQIFIAGNNYLAHRLMYTLVHGPIESSQMAVCHKCDNRLCVNPEHLFLGTLSENHADMVRKNRNVKGEAHPLAKLNAEQVVQIRNDQSPSRVLAEKYGVSARLIRRIQKRDAWKHV